MQDSWSTLENTVRTIAAMKWGTSANAKHVDGVDFDAVLEPSAEELIAIEVSKQFTLEKIRSDCAKINSIRISYVSSGIVLRGYIILEKKPTLSMIETGDANKVKVMSIDDFMNLFFKYDSYKTLRAKKPFGSAVNPLTGESDETDYIPVTYYSDDSTKKYTIEKITDQILKGGRTILIGDYGTGKSRCIHTIFKRLNSTESNCRKLVLAINLRDHWGASSAAEIIAGHLEELGLSGTIDNAMQIITSGGAILLLDGVDEVGAQTFGNSRENRKSVRKIALEGIRKLISLNIKNCVLLTSRSHDFRCLSSR